MGQCTDNVPVLDFQHPFFYPFGPFHGVFPATGRTESIFTAMVNIYFDKRTRKERKIITTKRMHELMKDKGKQAA